jgi:hypothetical protein
MPERASFQGGFHTWDRLGCRSSRTVEWVGPMERGPSLAERSVERGSVPADRAEGICGLVIGKDGTVDRHPLRCDGRARRWV